ncbi:MAG TPA: flagellar motor protein, partial [Chromatiales bacterium]|nr:flagellar motor protein [Chromatiales bacterium]
MDMMTIAGVILAGISIIGGNYLEGGHLSSLLLPVAFLIVGGGTLACLLVQTPLDIFMKALKLTRWMIFPPKLAAVEAIEKITDWSNIARKEGLLGLEALAENESDLFA